MNHETLRDLFRCIGEVDQVKLCKNKETKLSLGYGFVKYKREEDAMKAVQQLNGRTIQNKRIKVSFARPSSDIIKVNENKNQAKAQNVFRTQISMSAVFLNHLLMMISKSSLVKLVKLFL